MAKTRSIVVCLAVAVIAPPAAPFSLEINKKALEKAVTDYFEHKNNVKPPQNSVEKYMIDDVFGNPYWLTKVRGARFKATLKSGILYRQEMVDGICQQIEKTLHSDVPEGVMVKGPQGIGKSHSIVNVVRKLHSTGTFLVTFVPDCDDWDRASQLVDAICASFGSTPSALGITRSELTETTSEDTLIFLIDDVDEVLQKQDKKWVFVFDQINKLFVKPMNIHAKDASGLDFPFYMISQVQKAGRITSVIAASANNEMAYKEHHEGFTEYWHKTGMSAEELCMAFDGIDETNVNEVMSFSGGVPLYALLYQQNPARFQAEVNESVDNSLQSLRSLGSDHKINWNTVQESIFSSLLDKVSGARRYDKKFLVPKPAPSESRRRFEALFPAVLTAYRELLWDDLCRYVEEKEAQLLDVCKQSITQNDTRGRIFELIVIRRCQSLGVSWQHGGTMLNIGSNGYTHSEHFHGMKLPTKRELSVNGVYVPNNPNFTAIDVIWKHDDIVYGVQIHVAKHKNVAPSFYDMCRAANWFNDFASVNLLYLSPEDGVTELVRTLVEPPYFEPETTSEDSVRHRLALRAISKNSISCLQDLQWQEGCSLDSS